MEIEDLVEGEGNEKSEKKKYAKGTLTGATTTMTGPRTSGY